MTTVRIKAKPFWRVTLEVCIDGVQRRRAATVSAAHIGEVVDDKGDIMEKLADGFSDLIDSTDEKSFKRVSVIAFRIERMGA